MTQPQRANPDMPPMPESELSAAQRLSMLPEAEQQAFFDSLSEDEAADLMYEWDFWARPKQMMPAGLGTTFYTWFIMAGRGWGKTATGAQTIRRLVMEHGYKRVALVGRTSADVRDVMIEGESGLLAAFPKEMRPIYEPAKRRVTFKNGAIATTYSADKPDQLRGPQHDLVWSDELASWRYDESWDQIQFGLRLGDAPINIVTTTPRPTRLIKKLHGDPRSYVTQGTTYENVANLAAPAMEKFLEKYAGTRIGLQELEAHILEDTPGALWTRQMLDESRIRREQVPDLIRVVVGVDPNTSSTSDANMTGIVAVGMDRFGHLYVLDDWTMHGRPTEWAKRAILLYEEHDADRIVAEVNQGGDMVETTLRTVDANVSIKQVRASKGKHARAEPVSALYEKGRVHHVGTLGDLEDQQCTWVPGEESPDRVDALVWAITELALKNKGRSRTGRATVTNIYSSQNRSENKWG